MSGREREDVIAGALFDFLGYLTSRDGHRPIGSAANAAPFVEALSAWAAERGLNLDDANVTGWHHAAVEPGCDRQRKALQRIADAATGYLASLVDEPDVDHTAVLLLGEIRDEARTAAGEGRGDG